MNEPFSFPRTSARIRASLKEWGAVSRPLARCCNGCDAPPQPPSHVLCKQCLDDLSRKMHELAGETDGK